MKKKPIRRIKPQTPDQKVVNQSTDYGKAFYDALRGEREKFANQLKAANDRKYGRGIYKKKSNPGDLFNAFQAKKKAQVMKHKIDPYRLGTSIRTASKRVAQGVKEFGRGLTGKPKGNLQNSMLKALKGMGAISDTERRVMKKKETSSSTPTKKPSKPKISPTTIARVKKQVAKLGGMGKVKSRINQMAAVGAIPGFSEDLTHDEIAQRVIDAIKELVSYGQNAYAATKDDLSEFVSDLSWFFHVTTPPTVKEEEDPETPDYSNPAYQPPKTPTPPPSNPPSTKPSAPKKMIWREFKKGKMKKKYKK